MSLFRKQRAPMMAAYRPLPNPDYESILGRLSELNISGSVDERNSYANSLLAWAEGVGQGQFDKFRRIVFQAEIARNAREWCKRFPDDDTELAVAKLSGTMVLMTRDVAGAKKATVDDCFLYLGPDMPVIVDKVYRALVGAKLKS